MLLAPLSARFQSLPPLPTQSNWALLVLPGGWVCIHSRPLWVSPMNTPVRLSLTTASIPQVFSISGLRLYFNAMEPWVVQSVSFPSCSSEFIHTQMWNCLLHQPPPHWESSPPGCPSPPVLPVWINVSSLTP